MAYILKYQGEFSSIVNIGYRVEILEKDYVGINYSLQMSGVPVLHHWATDDPRAPIKGSSLSIKYLNKGSLPIESFISNSDDQFKVRFYQGTQLLFEGFLVQDDFFEPMLDYTHEVTLSANDSLGLIKDIALDTSAEVSNLLCYAQGDFVGITIPFENWINLTNINFTPVVGTPFTISGHSVTAMNGSFTPSVVLTISPTSFRVKVPVTTGDTAAEPCTINGVNSIPTPNGRLTLANIVHACLVKTGLELNTYIYCNLFEQSFTTTTSFLHQTYIEKDDFISGETYDNCYNVLEKICSTNNLSLFQALGRWNIVHWDELRRGVMNAFVYDKDFNLTGTATLPSNFTFGFQQPTFPEFGLSKSIQRPYEFSRETFNYQQPKYLLKNYDFSKLGTLLRTYTVGVVTVKEYVATDWEDTFGAPISERFIRIELDTLGNELVRSLVVRNVTFDTPRSVQSKPIEVTAGDKVKFSFSTKTNISQSGSINLVFGVRLFDGTNNRYVSNTPAGNGDWVPTIGFTYNIPSGDNSNQWHNVDIQSSQIPFSGYLYCYLAQNTATPQNSTRETLYKDVRLELVQYINDSTKVIGHIHKDKQNVIIKNNKDVEIFLDDSPRNTIQGTLFKGTFTGLIQDRTALWYRSGITESKKLGNIITREELQYRSISRTKLEGSFRGLKQDGDGVSYPGIYDFYTLTVPATYYAIHAASIPAGIIGIGDAITVTGSASNNGTFTVIDIWTAGSLFPLGSYMVQEVVVTEPGSHCTISLTPKLNISLLTWIKYSELAGLNFLFGNLEIDYRNNKLNCTLWELFNDTEPDVTEDYSFTYIYSTT